MNVGRGLDMKAETPYEHGHYHTDITGEDGVGEVTIRQLKGDAI